MECEGGEESLLLTGTPSDDHGRYGAGTWIRRPAGFRSNFSSREAAVAVLKSRLRG
jgi:hypothetical protein